MEDFINAGAYRPGSNPGVDEAIAKHDSIERFLIQGIGEQSSLEDTLMEMSELSGIEIPPEELTDNNAKIQTTMKNVTRTVKTSNETADSYSPSETSMALNSVAALFSSLPGMNVLDADVETEWTADDSGTANNE